VSKKRTAKLSANGRDCTNWGGPRPNSGRPALGNIRVAVMCPPDRKSDLLEYAARLRAQAVAGR
jgi:hypothetical protein